MRRSHARVLLVGGGSILTVIVIAAVASGPPTNRKLSIEDAAGVRQVCASVRTVAGDDEVDLGGAFVGAPQWLEADEPIVAALRPSPGVEVPPTAFHVTFVDARGRVISEHDSGPETITAARPWSGALLVSPGDAPDEPRKITADEGC